MDFLDILMIAILLMLMFILAMLIVRLHKDIDTVEKWANERNNFDEK